MNSLVNLALIITAIITNSPGALGITKTGKLLLSIASLNGLVFGLISLFDIIQVSKWSYTKQSVRIVYRINSLLSILTYAAFVYHTLIKDFEPQYTYVVPAVDLGINVLTWLFLLARRETEREYYTLFNPLLIYSRFMVWSKLIHFWSVSWYLVLLPIIVASSMFTVGGAFFVMAMAWGWAQKFKCGVGKVL